jgi:glycosyltransferase involved in cell wall biosynthesis
MFLPVSHAVALGNGLAQMDLPHEVVPNFVPDDIAGRADANDPALGDLPSGPFWLFVGALSRHKGVDVLLDAYAGLDQAPPLVIVGPPTADTFGQWPSGTVVLGRLGHAAVMAAWRRAELAIVPSVFPDPCPTVALEAMAAGVAVVGSNVGRRLDGPARPSVRPRRAARGAGTIRGAARPGQANGRCGT